MAGTKFSLLMHFGQKQPYFACWESFVPPRVCVGGCWESFVPGLAFSDAVGFTVMTSLCSGREKVRPVRSDVNANAKKFAQRGKNGLKIAVYGVLGEFFRATGLICPDAGVLFRVTRTRTLSSV